MTTSWPETGPDAAPLRSKIEPREWYERLDPGIRFAVRVLHAHGIDTCQSCQGGAGHAYAEPTIDLEATGDDCEGFKALAVLHAHGLGVAQVAIVWPVRHGLPYEKLWRITLARPAPERADEAPTFVWGYQATGRREF